MSVRSIALVVAFMTVLSGQAMGSELEAIPGLQGLDFSTVEIATMIAVEISDGGQSTNRLYARTFDRLKQHKLIPRPGLDDARMPRMHPILIVTLAAKRIADCPEKLLYVRRLELIEPAIRTREPRVYGESISFGSRDVFNEVIDHKEALIERFEADLDRMIDGFAQDYWDWNKVKEGR